MRLILALAVIFLSTAESAVVSVGPGKQYEKPCAAIRAASPGDTIEIDASGDYAGDVCQWTTNLLTIRGVNGRPKIDAAGRNSQGKGTWVVTGNDTLIDNVELTGAAVPDRNGAAIRQEGRNLTVRNAYIHHNENGILAGNSDGSEILIEYSQFVENGSGDGFTHNIYVNHIARFTMRFCESRRAVVGHLVKSRAAENHILYNMLLNEADGTASYEINLPNGGRSYIIGNIVQQGPRTGNSTMLAFREEGAHALNPDSSLFVIHNTFVNDRSAGTFLNIAASTPVPAVVRNNIFRGAGTVITQQSAVMQSNFSGQDPRFRDAANYDYTLRLDSPALGAAVADPLQPVLQYVPVACSETRLHANDAGALGVADAVHTEAPLRCRRIHTVANAANGLPGPVAPGSLITVRGSNLAGDVKINGYPAPAVESMVQVPYEAKPGEASVVVNVLGVDTSPFVFEIAETAPAIFVDDANRARTVPSPEGFITVLLTGIGPVDPPLATGETAPADTPAKAVLKANATIDGQPVEVTSLRLVPGTIGIAKAEIAAPSLPDGDYPLVISVGGADSARALLQFRLNDGLHLRRLNVALH